MGGWGLYGHSQVGSPRRYAKEAPSGSSKSSGRPTRRSGPPYSHSPRNGASAIKSWHPAPNRSACDEFEPSFRRHSSLIVRAELEVKNRRCLDLACPLLGKVRSGNIVRHGFYRTRSGKRRRIPVRRVRKDVLLDERHALLPSPTSKSCFRWGHRSQSRGCQHFRDFPDRRDCSGTP